MIWAFNRNYKWFEVHGKCQNKYQANGMATNGHNGLGNELIKKRLNLLYPEKHELDVQHEAGSYRVELKILNGTV